MTFSYHMFLFSAFPHSSKDNNQLSACHKDAKIWCIMLNVAGLSAEILSQERLPTTLTAFK